jgi:hypothetical protein
MRLVRYFCSRRIIRDGAEEGRLENLPPDVPDRVLRDTMSKYGDVKDVTEEQ